MWKKIVEAGPSVQEKFLRGVEVVNKMVGGTLGPAGRNRIIQVKYKAPWIINDGAEIARRIVLDDPIEDLAAQTIIEISMKTAEQAGDGTTTSVVIASELVRICMKKIKEESNRSEFEHGGIRTNPMVLWQQIRTESAKAIESLRNMAKPVKDKDLDNIISTSLENLEYGKTLGDLIRKIGKDGYISVEDNWATKYGVETEVIQGMKFLGSYASSYLTNSSSQKEALWEDTHVLVTNHKLESTQPLATLIKTFREKGHRRLVIIGGYSEGSDPFGGKFIEGVSKAVELSQMPNADNTLVLAIKAPSLTSEELHDVAIFCGATFIDKKIGIELPAVELKHLGYAKKVSATEDEVNMMGGSGGTKERVEVLKEQVTLEKDQMFKEKLLRRIANLTSGQGVIRVGAKTETERSYLKEKLKDAVSSAKVALEEGFVPGGGISFKKVAEELGKDSILYQALLAPYQRIQDNAGGIAISKTIINPLKVDRLALENACSGAGMLITSDGAIAEEKMTYGDYLEKVFQKAIPKDNDDWRADENQDYGRNPVRNR